ncbi:Putative uncharacterized protein [Lactococcus lactis subsp. lactis A12]|uniref:Uncharacterized protein n=1 Tax=Lactococcus lactis subsp. lactis A12 TaxID=1137134 RepID=S6EU87_LACLL|nr:Putative uncharacterized protein [Lactococcus lactis subsp. lactis A12]SBW30869.1 Hypothetical protein LLA12_01719 [Lactococcus lactis subsp. lactis]
MVQETIIRKNCE